MGRYPGAVWRPLPENETQPRYRKTLVIVHSQGFDDNDGTLYDDFNRDGNNLESTFFVRWDGVVEQYLDSAARADANRYANEEAVSIETEDNGDPNRQPWSPEQLDSLERLIRWLGVEHGIPMIRATAWDGTGVGFHTMWGSPSQWTPVAKSCPGTARIQQFEHDLLPRLAVPAVDDDALMDPLGAVIFAYLTVLKRPPESLAAIAWGQDLFKAGGLGHLMSTLLTSSEGAQVWGQNWQVAEQPAPDVDEAALAAAVVAMLPPLGADVDEQALATELAAALAQRLAS